MTSLGRALAGAAFGALLTLMLHPVSRPFLLSTAYRVPPDKLERCLDSATAQPAPPQDLIGASLWVQLALERIAATDAPLRPKEMQTVLKIAEAAAERDSDNAYWNQARAAMLLPAGQPMEARAAWIRASRAVQWNDYQSERLYQSRDSIASLVGTRQAWQLAYVFYHRSDSAATTIERFARALLRDADPTTEEGLTIRFATLRNGNLMRQGSRSVRVGQRGANIVELTTYPALMVNMPSPRRLWTGQTEMLDRMAKMGEAWANNSEEARTIFGRNEGWRALMEFEDPQELVERLSVTSVVTSGLTGTFAILAFVGGVLYLLGVGVDRLWGNQPLLKWPYVTVFTVGLGALGWWLTQDLFAGLCTALCTAFLGVTPPHVRRARPEDLGPLFTFLIVALASLFALTVVGYLLGTTPAASGLLPVLGIPRGYYNTPLLLGLSAVFLGLLLLAVPMWGLAQRLAIPHVLSLALRKFGATLGFGGLAFAILLTPASVYVDREIGETLSQLVGNEPAYHLSG
ncbi:MAG: hypothetical protein ACO1SV_16120 [Fimbriimonas sp.]